MKILAIIVNYKTTDTAKETLKSLLPQIKEIGDSQIMVIDNDSQDQSVERLTEYVKKENWEKYISIVDAGINGGFGAGNNFAIRKGLSSDSPPDYFYLINPDAVTETNALKALSDFLDSNLMTGVVGSSLQRPNGDKKVPAYFFPNIIDEFQRGLDIGFVKKILKRWLVAPEIPKETSEADWVTGASLMIRREMFEDIGLFDEKYFLYYEETDLCKRAKKKGWKVYHVKESSITHICGVSTGIKDKKKRTPDYLFSSRRYYFMKHHGKLILWLSNIFFIIGYSLRSLRNLLQLRKSKESPHYLYDFIRKSF